MNREDIFRMAQEVELINKDYDIEFLNKFTDKVEHFAALVASAEREAILAVIGDNQCECRCSEVVRARGQA